MSQDKHEELVKKFEQIVVDRIPEEYLQLVTDALIIAADNYEVQDRCTELVVMDTTNEQLIRDYLINCRIEGKRDKTIKYYGYQLKQFNDIVNKPFEEVTTYDVRKYLAFLSGIRKVSMTTVENSRSSLSPFFAWLAMEGIIEKNPMARIKPIKHQVRKEDPFSDAEIATMRDCITSKRDRAIIEVLLATGLRVSELVNLKLKDISFQDMDVYVSDGKGGKERHTYITPVCIRYIKLYMMERKGDSEYLFLGKRGPLTDNAIRYILKNIQEMSGVDNIHPHRFRHTFASNLAKAGMPIQQIQVLLGHRSIETTNIYVTTTNDSVKTKYMSLCA